MERGNYRFGLTLTPSMSIDVKVRIGLFLIAATIPVLSAHGLLAGPLDVIGGTGP